MAVPPDDCIKLTTVVVVDPNKHPELRAALIALGWTPPPINVGVFDAAEATTVHVADLPAEPKSRIAAEISASSHDGDLLETWKDANGVLWRRIVTAQGLQHPFYRAPACVTAPEDTSAIGGTNGYGNPVHPTRLMARERIDGGRTVRVTIRDAYGDVWWRFESGDVHADPLAAQKWMKGYPR